VSPTGHGFRITYDQGQFKRLSAKLSPTETKKVIHQTTDEVTDFLLDKVREYPAQKSVTRNQAFGRTFESERQRRWFFWALRSGRIQVPYQRTGALGRAWRIVRSSGDVRILTNEAPAARYIFERGTQSRMMKMIGWKTVSYWLQRYRSEIGRVALANVRRWVRK
jgi:hypothetical protein